MAKGHTIESFTNTVLLNELGQMVNDHGLLYLALVNISSGIEFLGACEDANPFDTEGKSGERFRLAISKFFVPTNPDYAAFNVKGTKGLYTYLRCGMLHMMIPKTGVFGVTGRASAQAAGRKHLDFITEQNKTLIVVEDLYDDFKIACDLMLKGLAGKTGSKYSSEFLVVNDLPPNSSAGTATTPALSGN